ncbi:putative membrane protein [Streptomyces venezuelae]|nr:putative membrane protein [Streptomyces venezuelae]
MRSPPSDGRQGQRERHTSLVADPRGAPPRGPARRARRRRARPRRPRAGARAPRDLRPLQGRGRRAAHRQERLRLRGAPAPSEGFLARLQGLPGGPGEPSGGSGGPGVPRGPLEELLGAAALKSDGFATAAVVTPNSPHPGTGFRIHEVGDRGSGTSGRGRRFAFAAASAVSFAAIALGGTLPVETSVSASGRGGQGTGSAVTPMRATATGGASGTTAATRGTRSGERSGAQSVAEEPLTPLAARTGAPAGRAPAGTVPSGAVPPDAVRSGRAPLVAVRLQNQAMQSFLALSPFIRPTGPALDLAFAPGPSPAASPTNAPLGSHR